MDAALKQRMVGALVLIALAVIFIPMILEGPPADSIKSSDLEIPPRPDGRQVRVIPVGENDREPRSDGSNERERPNREIPEDRQSLPVVDVGDVTQESSISEPDEPQVELADEQPAAGLDAEASTESTASAEPIAPPPTASSAPEPTVEVNDASGWLVQVGSFRNQANAVELVAQLREANFSARLESVRRSSGTLHRIRVGPYGSESEARDFRSRIKDQFPRLTPSVMSDAQASGGRSETVQTWVVQAGSFGERANADALRDRLRDGDYAAFVEPVGASYRVRVGPELSRGRADEVRDSLEKAYGIKGIVVSYR